MADKMYALHHHELRLKTSHDLNKLKSYHARRGVIGTAVYYEIKDGSWIELEKGEKI